MNDDQYNLYGGTPPHSDDTTSKAAAESIKPRAGSWRKTVYDYINNQGQYGATDFEIQRALSISPNTETPRRRELVQLGMVMDSGRVRKTDTGHNAHVWIVCAPYDPNAKPVQTKREELADAHAAVNRVLELFRDRATYDYRLRVGATVETLRNICNQVHEELKQNG